MIYFTSDTHYNHKNIVKGISTWKDGFRPFDTLQEYNDTIVNNINKVVKEEDTLYHLGDWSFGGIKSIWEFRKQLLCKDIHLVFGNHDYHFTDRKILFNVHIKEDDFFADMDKSSEEWNPLYDNLIDGPPKNHFEQVLSTDLFTSTQYYKEIKINGQLFILCHYAMRVWKKSHRGSIMLYGHSHGNLKDDGDSKSMDVGLDTHSEFRPYSITEILEIMNQRKIKKVDHH